MATIRTIEDLESSVRIKDIPENFNMDLIIEQLQNAGTMKEIIKGKKEMIVIFENPNFKDVSKMFNECPVNDDYTMKMEDAMTFDLQEDYLPSPKKENSTNKALLTELNMGYTDSGLNRSTSKEAGSPIKFDSATKGSPVKSGTTANEFFEFHSDKKAEKSEPQQLIKPEPTTRLSEPDPSSRLSFSNDKKEENLRFTDTNVDYTIPVDNKKESPQKESPKKQEFKIEDETEPQKKVIEEPKVQTPVKREEPVREPEQPKQEAPKEEPKIPEPKIEEPKKEEPKREEPKREVPKKEEPKREEPKREEPKPKEAPRVEETKAERRPEPKVSSPKKEFVAKSGESLSEILENTNLPDRKVLGADDPAKQIFDFKYIFITISIWALWNIISKSL